MEKVQNKINKVIFCEFILMFLIIIGNIFKLPGMVSLFFTLTFLVLLVSIIVELWINKVSRYHILLIFSIIAITIINITIVADTISFNYFKKAFMFISTILFFYLISVIKINRKTVDFILKVNLVIATIYPFAYFILGIKTTYGGGLTFNFTNPNLVAMYIFHSILYCLLAFVYYRNMTIKVILIVITLSLIYLLNKTLSRACLIALMIFFGMSLFNSFTKNKIKLKRGISFILLISPLIMSIVYMQMIETGVINIFNFAVSEGKALTSRYGIWREAFYSIKRNLILGNYYELSGGGGVSQMHNTHVDIIASYGVCVFILFIIILSIVVDKINNTPKNNFSKMSIFAFYSVIVMGTFEAALVSGGVGLYILSGGFLIFAKLHKDEDIQPIKNNLITSFSSKEGKIE